MDSFRQAIIDELAEINARTERLTALLTKDGANVPAFLAARLLIVANETKAKLTDIADGIIAAAGVLPANDRCPG
jgi:hypothetical protein